MFPSVQAADTQTGSQATNATSWTLTYPTNLVSGNLILLLGAVDGGVTVTLPSGWVNTVRNAAADAAGLIIGKKKSDGTETGNFTMTVSASEQGVWRTMRITGWEGTLGTNMDNDANAGAVVSTVSQTGTTTTPNPNVLDPNNWATEDTLWIAADAADHGNTTHTAFPTSYTQQDHSTAGGHSQESGGAGGAGLGLAFRQIAAATEDPGAFTIDAAEQWGAVTIGIRPAVGAPPRYGFIDHANPGVLMEKLGARWRRNRSGVLIPECA